MDDLHVFETCLKLVTFSACCEPVGLVVPAELAVLEADDVAPVILTSWPTWSLSFAVSPVS
jgi:hypothetical protein